MTLAAFCVGNIVGAETFLPKDAPNYIPGKTAILILLSVSFFLCFLIRWVPEKLTPSIRQQALIPLGRRAINLALESVQGELQRY